jgi:hypothetical protein
MSPRANDSDMVSFSPAPGLYVRSQTGDTLRPSSPGKPTPSAQVADNDLALGRVIEVNDYY